MDIAYDQVQESAYDPSSEEQPEHPSGGLNSEFQQAFKAVQSSPWGTTLGGWFSQARKQGETLASEAQEQATKGWEGLREQVAQRTTTSSEEAGPVIPGLEAVSGTGDDGNAEGSREDSDSAVKTDIIPKDIVKEAGTLVASLRLTAAATLKDLQAAEDAADDALLKFGTNVRNFLRDAVIISAPTDEDRDKARGQDGAGNEVLFETQEPGTGKKIFHTTRLDAQLHAIHTTASSFTEDPSQGAPWEEWQKEFDIEKQTDAISQDLEKFDDLRRAMEKLVPEKVEYKPFWTRYYFLRKAVEEEEKRRREVLKGVLLCPESMKPQLCSFSTSARRKVNRSRTMVTNISLGLPTSLTLHRFVATTCAVSVQRRSFDKCRSRMFETLYLCDPIAHRTEKQAGHLKSSSSLPRSKDISLVMNRKSPHVLSCARSLGHFLVSFDAQAVGPALPPDSGAGQGCHSLTGHEMKYGRAN
nr:bsd domain-containing protein c22a12.14c [Quercus suber]